MNIGKSYEKLDARRKTNWATQAGEACPLRGEAPSALIEVVLGAQDEWLNSVGAE